MLIKSFIVLTPSRRQNPHKIPFSLILQHRLHNYIPILQLRQPTQRLLRLLRLSQLLNHPLQLLRRPIKPLILPPLRRTQLRRPLRPPKRLWRRHISSFRLVRPLHPVLQLVHRFLSSIESLDPDQVERVRDELGLDVRVQGALAGEAGAEVDFEKPGFEVGVQEDVEPEEFEAVRAV